MPMDIMMNPILADEPPKKIDKMESIFMKSDLMKNIKSMNIDEIEIMESINGKNVPLHNDETESDIIAMENERTFDFSLGSDEDIKSGKLVL